MTDVINVVKLVDAPWLLLLIAIAVAASAVLRIMAESYEIVAKLLGPLGKRWQDNKARRLEKVKSIEELESDNRDKDTTIAELRAELANAKRDNKFLRDQRDNNAWTTDLRRQVEHLSREMTYLRRRGEMNDAYLRMDANYHLWDSLGRQGEAPQYVPYVEFERRWIAEHGPFDDMR